MNRLNRRSVLACGLIISVLTMAGCGGPVGPTSGFVKFTDGTPVTSGSIELRRRTDRERFSSRIGVDGSFQPVDKDGRVGIEPGNYEVVVVQIVLTEDLAKEAHTHGGTVPRRYADYYTSGLRIEIESGDTDPIEITVESLESDNLD